MGRIAEPLSAALPLPQLILSNIIFDGATISFTIWVLQKFPLGTAIVLDILVSGMFACGSLWCGLVGTSTELSLRQVLRVLFFSSSDGSRISLGPHFWIMHSTFMPTLIYLSTIAVAYVAKVVSIGIAKFLKRGANPHGSSLQYIGFTTAILVAVLQGLAQIVGDFEDRAKAKEVTISKSQTFLRGSYSQA